MYVCMCMYICGLCPRHHQSQRGAITLDKMGEAKVRVYVDLPEMMQDEEAIAKAGGDKKRLTEVCM